MRPYLDVLLLGRAQAINLGVSYESMTRLLLILVALLVSISTAFSWSCYILGLLTVNLAHELMKTYEHKYILPATILMVGLVYLWHNGSLRTYLKLQQSLA